MRADASAARARGSGVRAALLGALVCAAGSTTRGQQPDPPVEALDHTVWTVRDGAPSGVRALAQSADGVLWIGANSGLYRFDGMRFEPFEPPSSRPLPALSVSALLALPDGTLWIGYNVGGVSVLARREVVSYGQRDGLPEGTVNAFARDSAGDVWAATTTGLARLRGGRWHRVGAESGFPGGMTPWLLVDRRGTLWAPTPAGVFVLPRGARRFSWQAPSLAPSGEGVGMPDEAPDGSVWGASLTLGLTRLSDSAGRATPARPAAERLREAITVTVDRRANAWVAGPASLSRVALAPRRAHEAASRRTSGLLRVERVPVTSDPTTPVLDDREGNVWVGTGAGIERFRETKLTPVPLPEPITGASVVPAASGSVWIGRYNRPLLAIRDGVVTDGGAPTDITCAYRDLGGGVWFGGPRGMWHAPGGDAPASARFTRVPLPEEAGTGDVQAIARSADGDLWVSIRGGRMKGVFRRRGSAWAPVPLPPGFSNQIALTVVADSGGRVWLGYVGNRLVLAAGDSTRVYTDRDGLHVGTVTALLARGSEVWVGGELGLTLLADGRFHPVGARAPLRGVTGIVETTGGDVWVNGAGGVTYIATAEVRRALRDSAYRTRVERFDHHDGLRGDAPQVRPLPTAIQAADGRLWFTTETGLAWIDPANVRRNRLPPPVQIRAVSAAGTRYDVGERVALPARSTQLQIAYTALSLAVPDRVEFRYRLTGVDTAWVEAGTRREAHYTNLAPGAYRFRVIAANEDGVWNESGASVELEIPPTFTQTGAFLALVASAVVGAVWLLVLWRQRQLARALRAQFEGQLAERARVARELHDTLLGDMAGVAMQLTAGARHVAKGDGDSAAVVDLLSSLSSQVQRSLVEVRGAVTALRTHPPLELFPLHAQLAAAAQRTFGETGIAAHVAHTGPPRPCPPALEAEIVAIATEAMVNARRHARCRTVRVTCSYERHAVRVRLRDDGRGFDPSATPAGHWGLIGMRERAESIGATLTITSEPSAGTEVALAFPGAEARRTWRTRLLPSLLPSLRPSSRR
jgi:signal transduction histidine kinase/ligand-binding sensor domain-containing protein